MTAETWQLLSERRPHDVQEPRRRGQENKQDEQNSEQRRLGAVALHYIRRRIERVAVLVMPLTRKVDDEMNVRNMVMDRAAIGPFMRVVAVMKMIVKRKCRRYEHDQNQQVTDSASIDWDPLIEGIHVGGKPYSGDLKLARPRLQVNRQCPARAREAGIRDAQYAACSPVDIRRMAKARGRC